MSAVSATASLAGRSVQVVVCAVKLIDDVTQQRAKHRQRVTRAAP